MTTPSTGHAAHKQLADQINQAAEALFSQGHGIPIYPSSDNLYHFAGVDSGGAKGAPIRVTFNNESTRSTRTLGQQSMDIPVAAAKKLLKYLCAPPDPTRDALLCKTLDGYVLNISVVHEEFAAWSNGSTTKWMRESPAPLIKLAHDALKFNDWHPVPLARQSNHPDPALRPAQLSVHLYEKGELRDAAAALLLASLIETVESIAHDRGERLERATLLITGTHKPKLINYASWLPTLLAAAAMPDLRLDLIVCDEFTTSEALESPLTLDEPPPGERFDLLDALGVFKGRIPEARVSYGVNGSRVVVLGKLLSEILIAFTQHSRQIPMGCIDAVLVHLTEESRLDPAEIPADIEEAETVCRVVRYVMVDDLLAFKPYGMD